MGATGPLGHGQLGPQGTDWQDLCRKLPHNKSDSSGPHDFREEDFSKFFNYTVLYKHMTFGGVASWTPGA